MLQPRLVASAAILVFLSAATAAEPPGKRPASPAGSDPKAAAPAYVAFPALVFTGHDVATSGGKTRITFKATWNNLAPQAVDYAVRASVMPRLGKTEPLFKIVSVSAAPGLHLDRGQSVPFSLTVEAAAQLPPKYSEMIRLDLDLRGSSQTKPYLMSAATGYLDIDPTGQVPFRKRGRFVLPDDVDPKSVYPSRQTLGYKDGTYERSMPEAFRQALATAAKPVILEDGRPNITDTFNATEWAKANMPMTWHTVDAKGASKDFFWGMPSQAQGTVSYHRDYPIPQILTGASLRNKHEVAKRVMLMLAQEYPFYPSPRWDLYLPTSLPEEQYEMPGTTELGVYARACQAKAVSDDEHFLILHNVVLPIYLTFRADLRLGGALAQPVKAGDYIVNLAGRTPASPFVSISSWIRVGKGDRAECVRLWRTARGGFELDHNMYPGPFKYDHAAGEPWDAVCVREWLEMEATDILSFMCTALASRDDAVIEQCMDMIRWIYKTQHIFNDDGSFVNEPGSYGWGYFSYIEQLADLRTFFGADRLALPQETRRQILNGLLMWNEFPFSDGMMPMLNGGGAVNQLARLPQIGNKDPKSLFLLKQEFPDQKELIQHYEKVISQEANRKPGSMVDNRSFKVDGWGYAMLRGSGPWDSRMETLLASKHLLIHPGDHVSRDALGLCLFAHGAIMTPRYGYHWANDLDFFVNRARIDDLKEPRVWGDFVHFDGDKDMPSAVASTDMCQSYSTTPGPAHQQRWCVQLPEYLFDAYFVRPRDKQAHVFQWGFRNLGELAISSPQNVQLTAAKNDDGSPWDPIGYYRKNAKHDGMGFDTGQMWQADWTMNEGNVSFPPSYANPPKGARIRLTMAAQPQTNIVTAFLTGPARNETANLRQDFLVVKRKGADAAFVDTLEPIPAGGQGLVKAVDVLARGADGSIAAKVTTAAGVDYFLVGADDIKTITDAPKGGTDTWPAADAKPAADSAKPGRAVRAIGPFTTDAAIAVIRVRDGKVVRAMMSGGTSLKFTDSGVKADYASPDRGTRHFTQ